MPPSMMTFGLCFRIRGREGSCAVSSSAINYNVIRHRYDMCGTFERKKLFVVVVFFGLNDQHSGCIIIDIVYDAVMGYDMTRIGDVVSAE